MSLRKAHGASPANSGAVDIHCHVFNSHDVPVRKFVELVYLEKYPGGSLLNPLITLIESIMNDKAPTTREEIDELTGANLNLQSLPRRGTSERKIAAVANALKQMLESDNAANREWVWKYLSEGVRKKYARQPSPELTNDDFTASAEYLLGLPDIGTWIDFAFIYTKARWEITEELAGLSPEQHSDVFLYTPAMLDIGTWVGQPNTSPLAEQIELMQLISRFPGKSYSVHAFVPFDPLRASALEHVKDAVLEYGCVGVKLYPPMGFKPLGNQGPNGKLLDRQMREFLRFCLDEDVPILAHCSFSQFVTPEAGACAAPTNWKLALDKGFRNLRLNLGHCGGPWALDTNKWTETAIAMLGSGKYPHLYADLGDDSWIIESSNADKVKNRKLMRKLFGYLRDHPKARQRLLYGSDWSLLARERSADQYYHAMKTRFCEMLDLDPAECRGYLGGNAVRFLGLAEENGAKPKNRQRLERFRAKHNLDTSIFKKIDAMTA
jgi:predicted TIM-barrel fold metal-dependent hydrolase